MEVLDFYYDQMNYLDAVRNPEYEAPVVESEDDDDDDDQSSDDSVEQSA